MAGFTLGLGRGLAAGIIAGLAAIRIQAAEIIQLRQLVEGMQQRTAALADIANRSANHPAANITANGKGMVRP